MTEPSRTLRHAQANGFATVDEYCVELEDALEAIVTANRPGPYTDPDDMFAAIFRAYEIVNSWEQA